jgi:shikimate dehydrogenase
LTRSRSEGRYLVGLIGSGIGRSLSPALHEREADEFGLRYLYSRLDLAVLGLPAAEIGSLVTATRLAGYTGLNVTHPGKQLVLDHLDGLAPDAAAVGAVNTVVFAGGKAVGHNTDLSGFARSIRVGLPDVPLDRVVLLGAGGAGAAVSQALLSLGTMKLCVFDKDQLRADTLAGSLEERFGAGRVSAGRLNEDLAGAVREASGLVHATPTGMAAYPGMPLPAELLTPDLWVADIVYRPLDTELVTTARDRGCRVLDGGMMAVFQAADAFRLFTGHEPDSGRMLRHFETLVHAETPGRSGTHAHR